MSECDLLGSLGVVDTLDLDQAGAWGGVALAALVAQMASPEVIHISMCPII